MIDLERALIVLLTTSCLVLYLYKQRLARALRQKEHELTQLRLVHANCRQQEDQARALEQKIGAAMQQLSLQALQQNSQLFLQMAQSSFGEFQQRAAGELGKKELSIRHLVEPLQECLQRLEQGMQKIEQERKSDHGALQHNMRSLLSSEERLQQQTQQLAMALKSPTVRGRWGEIQLKRVVELAGMVNHCDFFEQQIAAGEQQLRPDLLIRLPGQRQVLVDAKVPLDAYLAALESNDSQQRQEKLRAHAASLRARINELSKKAYWEKFPPTPEFVVLFLPAEAFFSAALEQDPTLIERGAEKNVILATPTTLIALLRTVAYGWRQETVTQHREEIHRLGLEIAQRALELQRHFSRLGKSLSSTVLAFNRLAASLQRRLLASVRKMQDLGLCPTERGPQGVDSIDPVYDAASEENGADAES